MLISSVTFFLLFFGIGQFAVSLFTLSHTGNLDRAIISGILLLMAVITHIATIIIEKKEVAAAPKSEMATSSGKEDFFFYLLNTISVIALGAFVMSLIICIRGEANWRLPFMVGWPYAISGSLFLWHCIRHAVECKCTKGELTALTEAEITEDSAE